MKTLQKRSLCYEISLCSSRACLGKWSFSQPPLKVGGKRPFSYSTSNIPPLIAPAKNGILRHLYLKTIILPRQAQDKHRENSKKDAVFRTDPRLA
jgi:hypothetical protein